MDEFNNIPQNDEINEHVAEPISQPTFVTQQPEDPVVIPQEAPKKKFDGLGLAAMICGIAGTAGASLTPAIVGLILGCINKPDITTGKKTTFAKLGIIFGAIGIGLGIISLIISVFWADSLYEMFGDFFSSGGFDIENFSGGDSGNWT